MSHLHQLEFTWFLNNHEARGFMTWSANTKFHVFWYILRVPVCKPTHSSAQRHIKLYKEVTRYHTWSKLVRIASNYEWVPPPPQLVVTIMSLMGLKLKTKFKFSKPRVCPTVHTIRNCKLTLKLKTTVHHVNLAYDRMRTLKRVQGKKGRGDSESNVPPGSVNRGVTCHLVGVNRVICLPQIWVLELHFGICGKSFYPS